jgi:hypothetical protein
MVLGFIEEAMSETQGEGAKLSSREGDPVPELDSRFRSVVMAVSTFHHNLASRLLALTKESSALVVGKLREGEPEVCGKGLLPGLVKGHSSPGAKVHMRASASLITLSAGWTTVGSFRFSANPNVL